MTGGWCGAGVDPRVGSTFPYSPSSATLFSSISFSDPSNRRQHDGSTRTRLVNAFEDRAGYIPSPPANIALPSQNTASLVGKETYSIHPDRAKTVKIKIAPCPKILPTENCRKGAKNLSEPGR